MMTPNLARNLMIAFTLAIVFALPPTTSGEDAILYPGYLTGSISLGQNYIEGVGVSAYSNAYSASNYRGGQNYALTLQGGDFDYKVQTYALLREAGTSYPYTYIYFQPRQVRVPVGATVTSDYKVVNPGTLRIQLNMTGDRFNSWSAYVYACKYTPEGTEQSFSSSRNGGMSATGPAVWDIPVVPNEQVRISANVYIDNKNYTFFTESGTERYVDISPGETVTVVLNAVYSDSSFGTLQGTIDLGNLDEGSFSGHYVGGVGDGRMLNTNPSQYLLDRLVPGKQHVRASSYMDDWQTYFKFPYTNGRPENDLLDVQSGGYYTKDFVASSGKLEGNLLISGTAKNADWSSLNLAAYGQSPYWDTARNLHVYPETNGGYAITSRFDSEGGYRLYLTQGPWMPYYVSGFKSGYQDGAYYSRSFYIHDYLYTFDSSMNAGEIADIEAGNSIRQDRSYCTGSASFSFRVDGGGVISSPSVTGSFSRIDTSTGRNVMSGGVSGYSGVSQASNPVVEIHGVPGNYTFDCTGTTADGSDVNFAQIEMDLECGVRKGRYLSGPKLAVTSPVQGLVTNAEHLTVVGTASDEAGIVFVTVNGAAAPFTSTGNVSAPKEVAFSRELMLSGGKNTIRTEAADNGDQASFDERDVFVDRWVPVVGITSPATSASIPAGQDMTIDVQASDQGYGFTMQVFVDGNLIATIPGAGNDMYPVEVGYHGTVPSLSGGPHEVKAVVVDRAGNSATTTVTINNRLDATLTVKPEARQNQAEGVVTFFVKLPDGLTRYASLSPQDYGEVTASQVQLPFEVKYSPDDDKVILKFRRTPELMSDTWFVVEGKCYPDPANPAAVRYWKGSDTTRR